MATATVAVKGGGTTAVVAAVAVGKRAVGGGSLKCVWSTQPEGCAAIEGALRPSMHHFVSGKYKEFVTTFSDVWKGCTARQWVVGKWLPNLYFQFIGYGSITLAFDLYELALDPTADKLAMVLARLIAAATRMDNSGWAKPRLNIGPENSRNTSWYSLGPLPHLWRTPSTELGVVDEGNKKKKKKGDVWEWESDDEDNWMKDEKYSGEEKKKKEAEPLQPSEIMNMMYQSEWTNLFAAGAGVKQNSYELYKLFQFAIWMERLRPHIHARAFLSALDNMCHWPSTLTGFRTITDPDGTYGRTLRLFLRTMRSFLVQDIGNRIYTLFYMFVTYRQCESVNKSQQHHHPVLLEQLTDIDTFYPPTVQLQKLILNLLNHPKTPTPSPTPAPTPSSTAAAAQLKDKSKAEKESCGDEGLLMCGLPAGERMKVWLESMDWSHPCGTSWIAAMEQRYRVRPNTGQANKLPVSLAPDMEGLHSHLLSLDQLAELELKAQFTSAHSSHAKEDVGDEGLLASCPRMRWGESGWKASVDEQGRFWVGPFDSTSSWHRLMTGRVLFRTRKLKQWNIHVLAVNLVLSKPTAKGAASATATSYWLRFEGVPISNSALQELARNNNRTTAQILDPRQLDLYELGQSSISVLTTIPQTPDPTHPYGIVQFLMLQMARALLGISESSVRETLTLNPHSPSKLTLVPTSMFQQRNVQSYRASMAILQKAGKKRRLEDAQVKRPTRKIVSLFGRRAAHTVANRAQSKSNTAAAAAGAADDTECDVTDYLTDEDIRIADTGAILFGKSTQTKTILCNTLLESVRKPAFLQEARSRMQRFFDSLRRETELVHIRSVLQIIYNNIPLALSPGLALHFKLQRPPDAPQQN